MSHINYIWIFVVSTFMTPDTQGFWCPSLPWRDSIIFYNSYFRLVQILYRRQHNFIDLKLNFRVNRATEIAYLELCFAREPDFHSEFQGAMFLTHQTCHSRNTKAVEVVQNTTSNPSNIQFLHNYHEDPFGDSSFITNLGFIESNETTSKFVEFGKGRHGKKPRLGNSAQDIPLKQFLLFGCIVARKSLKFTSTTLTLSSSSKEHHVLPTRGIA